MPYQNGMGRGRRLQLFDLSLGYLLSPRILQLDLDCVIVGDLTPLVADPAPFKIWQQVHTMKAKGKAGSWQIVHKTPEEESLKGGFNASMMLMDNGVFPRLWEEYKRDRAGVEKEAKRLGLWTAKIRGNEVVSLQSGDDDQAVVSLYARPLNPPLWKEADGIYKAGRIGGTLPENARIVFFQGERLIEISRSEGWVRDHWK